MRGWVCLLVIACASCVQAELVECADGRACPVGTVCDDVHAGCVAPEQLTACAGSDAFASCAAIENGRCFDGVCLPGGCGNAFVEPEENCDDANTVSGDGCSADCRSREVCGDGFADAQRGEQCDDGGQRGRDGCSSVCTLEEIVWREHGGSPSPRMNAAVVYDPLRRRLLMFGGRDASGAPLGDTWEWNGSAWTKIALLIAPPPREGHALSYDEARHRVILFGGRANNQLLHDTWEWDGSVWALQRALVTPQARYGHAMAWDAANQRTLLFGGGRTGSVLDDTWTWDGVTWRRLAISGPPGRVGHGMAYDRVGGRIVVFGGDALAANTANDTWVFDGTAWMDISGADRPPSMNAYTMVYDPVRASILVVGTYSSRLVWELRGTTWTQLLSTLGPEYDPDAGFAVGYDLGRRVLVQFGGGHFTGAPVYGGLFELAGRTWSERAPAPLPPPRAGAALASDSNRGRLVLFGGVNNNVTRGDTWEWNGEHWTSTLALGPTPRTSHVMTFHPRVGAFLFGGTDGNNVRLGDTWTWNGTSWQQRMGPGPGVRTGMAIAYDALRDRVVLFGGFSASVTTDETWLWSEAGWTSVTPATSPSPRYGAAMAFDAQRGRVVLFGGTNDVGKDQADTWEWDGTTWTERPQSVAPEARTGHQMIFDRIRGTIWMIGGLDNNFSQWEWDGTSWTQPLLFVEPVAGSGVAVAYDDARGETVLFGGYDNLSNTTSSTWIGSYRGERPEDCASGFDLDLDGAIGCADSDCAALCVKCGDGTCSSLEGDRMCPADCPAGAALCGDVYCQPAEVCPSDCPP